MTLARIARWMTGAVVVLFASSCAARAVDRLMHDWHGHDLRELVTTWGPPRYAYSDGTGGHVVLYVPESEQATAANLPVLARGAELAGLLVRNALPNAEPVFPPRITTNWRVFRVFFIDADGTIRRSQWKGQWRCCGT